MTFVSGLHAKEAEGMVFSGIDILLGKLEGKSSGTVNPMLFAGVICAFMSAVFSAVWRHKAFPKIITSLGALCFLLLFYFDFVYSSKSEFSLAAESVTMAPGYYIACAASLLALIANAVDAAILSGRQRAAQRAAIFQNSALPEGYRARSISEIIMQDMRRHWPVYLLILPTIIYYAVWCYGPMYGIIIAFNDFSPKKGITGSTWVGLRWLREFMRSPFAYRTIRNTLTINLYNLAIGFPLPIILALMLNEMRSLKYKRVVQTITYMPYFISLIVVCGIILDFSSTDGLFGAIQRMFGREPVNLLGEARFFRTVYISSELWQRLGWDSIIFLSALSMIDQELYEAATIDGAGKLKQVWHITLPGITPTIAILLILRIGSMMNIGYEKIILLYNGLNYETSDVVSSYVYRKGIMDADFSYSTAVNLFNSIINFTLVILANRTSAKMTESSLW
jgi:putative aldouronate transport system permease protein